MLRWIWNLRSPVPNLVLFVQVGPSSEGHSQLTLEVRSVMKALGRTGEDLVPEVGWAPATVNRQLRGENWMTLEDVFSIVGAAGGTRDPPRSVGLGDGPSS